MKTQTNFTDFAVKRIKPIAETRPLRVLMVAVRYYPHMGGVETHVYEVARRLAKLGVEVTVLTADPAHELPADEYVEGVHVLRVGSWPAKRDFGISPRLYSIIQRKEWDVIHCQGYHTLFPPLAMLAAGRAKIPYVVSFHSGGHSSKLRNAVRGIQWETLRPLFARAERLVAVSQFEAGFFQNRLRLPAAKFVTVPNGSQLPQVATQDEAESGTTTIISIGRLERYKGHHRAIAAFPRVLEQYPEARLRVLGAGPYEADLRQMAQQLNLTERVEIGPIPPDDRQGMAKALSKAALVTLFSEYEAHPIAVMEALSLRRPVLVANTSGLRELAERGLVRAVPLESTDEDVAKAMISQLAQPLIPASIELPTWEDCTANLLDLYQSIARRSLNCVS